GNEDAPAVISAVDEGEVGGPALIGLWGNGTRGFDAWATAGAPFGECPAFAFHDAVDFLDIDVFYVPEAQAAPCASHAAGGFVLVDAFDAGCEGLINGAWFALPWLVVGCGSGETEPLAKTGDGGGFARREEQLPDLVHEFASGRGFPRMSLAIIQTSFSM